MIFHPQKTLPAVQSPFKQPSANKNLPVQGDESIMRPKKHGTSNVPVQQDMRWNCDRDTADRICNYNRHYAEYSGYFQETKFVKEAKGTPTGESITFYDSNTGKPLFQAPQGRTMTEFLKESTAHGWPSFRDEEVNWEEVRCLPNGEAVSLDGTHLGHNLPDDKGNRYCINLVSVGGKPVEDK
jgi:peptide methionine sulfoxide reductase MsrB